MAFCDDNPIFEFEMAHLSREWIFDSDVRDCQQKIRTPEIAGQKPELYLEELFSILGV